MADPQGHAQSPLLHSVDIADLRPTQMTVGMREVEQKRKEWRTLDVSKTGGFLGRHMIPVVRGPKSRNYVVDHHHFGMDHNVDLAPALTHIGVE